MGNGVRATFFEGTTNLFTFGGIVVSTGIEGITTVEIRNRRGVEEEADRQLNKRIQASGVKSIQEVLRYLLKDKKGQSSLR